MGKKYRLSVTEIDENGNEKELIGEDVRYLNRLALLGEVNETGCVEILINESISRLAHKIITADKFYEAARMGVAVKTMIQMNGEAGISGYEDALSESIEGGLQ